MIVFFLFFSFLVFIRRPTCLIYFSIGARRDLISNIHARHRGWYLSFTFASSSFFFLLSLSLFCLLHIFISSSRLIELRGVYAAPFLKWTRVAEPIGRNHSPYPLFFFSLLYFCDIIRVKRISLFVPSSSDFYYCLVRYSVRETRELAKRSTRNINFIMATRPW